MWRKVLRFITGSESTASFGEYLIRALKWFGIWGGAGITSIVAWASEWLNEYGPISWLIAGLLGALLISWSLAGGAKIASWLSDKKIKDSFAGQPHSINPLDSHFYKKLVTLKDFQHPFNPHYRDKIFEECDIMGPGIILFSGGAIISNDLRMTDWVEISDSSKVKSAILFENCTFKNCRFYRVMFLTEASFKYPDHQKLRQANWLNMKSQ